MKGITDDILSVNRAIDQGATVVFSPEHCYIEWPDGQKATFVRQGKQFVLPYQEKVHTPRNVRIAVVDEEAEAVAAYAAQEHTSDEEEEEQPVEEDQEELDQEPFEVDVMDLEQQAEMPEEPQPAQPNVPAAPSAAERAAHELTHLPYQPWCEECISGKGREGHHRRASSAERAEKPHVIQMDYLFLGRHGEQVDGESALLTILVLVDTETGWPWALQIPTKGMEKGKYAVENIALFLDKLGYEKVVLQHDQENPLAAVAKAVQRHQGATKISVRASPVKSHQSQGSVESANGMLAGQIRTMWMALKARYPEIEPTHNIMPWLVRHAAWLVARYQVKTADKMTAYHMVCGQDYNRPICRFGEAVMGKTPMTDNKLNRRWLKGIWLGKLERDDSHIIGTSAGAVAVRTVRRLPEAGQTDAQLLNEMRGVPWQPKDGNRLARREISQPVVIPVGPLALHPPEDYTPEALPQTAIDVANPDLDELNAAAADQIEEALGELAEEADGTPAAAESPAPADERPAEASPYRGAGWSSPMAALPDSPMSPTGLGGGGHKREGPSPSSPTSKAPRIAGVTALEVWEAIQQWGESHETTNPFALHRISNVADYVDQLLDPVEVNKARKMQLKKLWDRHAFTPVLPEEVPKGAQVFGHKWVDKSSRGVHKSRFTCADVKARYTSAQENELDVFVPTPTPESHALLEIYALQQGYFTRSMDIVAAFLIGADRGATEGKPVYVRAPAEWEDIFLEWLKTLAPAGRSRYQHRFRELLFRLDGNLYGRRTAGSVYRNELEEILIKKLNPNKFHFVRGVKDPTVFRCTKTGIILIHHVDDIRAAGPESDLAELLEKEFPKYCEIQCGDLERIGTAVEVLGRTKIRTKHAILTLADPRHIESIKQALGVKASDRSEVPSKQLNLLEVEPLNEEQTKAYRSAVGSAIYLSSDRRDIQFAVKELARHMSAPRHCDFQAAKVLGAYRNRHPNVVKVVALDPDINPNSTLSLETFTDSDWAGCLETRRSTDCYVITLGGAVVQCGTQTQPGLPATSSPDAELRGVSRGSRESIFVEELARLDFKLSVSKPKLWTDSSSAMQASKRIGPGSKLRHLEVCEFYVQGALHQKKLALGKIKGTYNPANFLTKHPKSGTEVRAALPSIGMFESSEEEIEQFTKINVKVSSLKAKWKPTMPIQLTLEEAGSTAKVMPQRSAGSSALAKCHGSNSGRLSVVTFAATAVTAAGQGEVPDDPDQASWWIFWILLVIVLMAGCYQIWKWIWVFLFRTFCPQYLEPDPEPQEARDVPLIPRNFQMINLNLNEGEVPREEAELWDVVFTVPRGRRIHLGRNCPTLVNSDPATVDMHRVCQQCRALERRGRAQAAKAKPKAKVKAMEPPGGQNRRRRRGQAPEREAPPERGEPPEPEPL